MTTLTDTIEPLTIYAGQPFEHTFPDLGAGIKTELVKLENIRGDSIETVVASNLTTHGGHITLSPIKLTSNFAPTLHMNHQGRNISVDYFLEIPNKKVKINLEGPPYYITRKFNGRADASSVGNTLLGFFFLLPFAGAIVAASILEGQKANNLLYYLPAVPAFILLVYPLYNYFTDLTRLLGEDF